VQVVKGENELLINQIALQNEHSEPKDKEIQDLNEDLSTLHFIRHQETASWQANITNTLHALQGRIDELEAGERASEGRNRVLVRANRGVVSRNKESSRENEELGEVVKDFIGKLDVMAGIWE
jgi:hypothetical protein